MLYMLFCVCCFDCSAIFQSHVYVFQRISSIPACEIAKHLLKMFSKPGISNIVTAQVQNCISRILRLSFYLIDRCILGYAIVVGNRRQEEPSLLLEMLTRVKQLTMGDLIRKWTPKKHHFSLKGKKKNNPAK